MDRLIGWCFGLLLAAGALFGAVKLLEAVWPALLVIGGVIGLIAGAIVVIRTQSNSW